VKTPCWFILVALGIALMGCGQKGATHAEAEAGADNAQPVLQLFEKGKGIRLPDEMAKAFGVESVEVSGRSFAQRVEAAATVYQPGSGAALARATALLNADEAAALAIGQAVKLQPANHAGSNVLSGRLAKLEPQTAAFGQVEALIQFEDAEGRHPVGTSLLATFTGPERKSDHAIPAAAIIQGADAPFVYTVNGSHFGRTPVKVGARSDGWAEITDGLYAGDVVVARGGEEMWMIELCALKGGTPCCPVGKKPGRADD
jgi:hypothetical protein